MVELLVPCTQAAQSINSMLKPLEILTRPLPPRLRPPAGQDAEPTTGLGAPAAVAGTSGSAQQPAAVLPAAGQPQQPPGGQVRQAAMLSI